MPSPVVDTSESFPASAHASIEQAQKAVSTLEADCANLKLPPTGCNPENIQALRTAAIQSPDSVNGYAHELNREAVAGLASQWQPDPSIPYVVSSARKASENVRQNLTTMSRAARVGDDDLVTAARNDAVSQQELSNRLASQPAGTSLGVALALGFAGTIGGAMIDFTRANPGAGKGRKLEEPYANPWF